MPGKQEPDYDSHKWLDEEAKLGCATLDFAAWKHDSFVSSNSAHPFPWEVSSMPPSPEHGTCPGSHCVKLSSVLGMTPKLSSCNAGPVRATSYVSRCSAYRACYEKNVPLLAGVCAVESPEVQREHLRIVRQGFLLGLVVACLLGAVLLAVPNA